VITVDCCNGDEQMSAFHAVFAEEVSLPAEAAILGTLVQVLDFDIREDGTEPTAHCRRGAVQQELDVAPGLQRDAAQQVADQALGSWTPSFPFRSQDGPEDDSAVPSDDRNKQLTSEDVYALGGTRTPNLLISRSDG